MAQGPLGAPRPVASSTISVKIALNKSETVGDETRLAKKAAQRRPIFNRSDEIKEYVTNRNS